jgi:gamma-glutamyl phosphate reductase
MNLSESLNAREEEILAANVLDIREAQQSYSISDHHLDDMPLTKEKLRSLSKGFLSWNTN